MPGLEKRERDESELADRSEEEQKRIRRKTVVESNRGRQVVLATGYETMDENPYGFFLPDDADDAAEILRIIEKLGDHIPSPKEAKEHGKLFQDFAAGKFGSRIDSGDDELILSEIVGATVAAVATSG